MDKDQSLPSNGWGNFIATQMMAVSSTTAKQTNDVSCDAGSQENGNGKVDSSSASLLVDLQGVFQPPTADGSDSNNNAIARFEADKFEYFLRDKEIVIGRSGSRRGGMNEDEQVSVFISRRHMKLFHKPGNGFFVSCLSKNGLFVNDMFMRKNQPPRKLPANSVFRFPSTNIKLCFQSLIADEPDGDDKISVVDQAALEDALNIANENLDDSELLRPGFVRYRFQKLESDDDNHSNHASTDNSRKKPVSAKRKIESPPEDDYSLSLDPINSNETSDGDSEGKPVSSKQKIESPEDDYSSFSDPNVLPPFSYRQLICQAIESSPDKRVPLADIYKYIEQTYPYYKASKTNWKNSIRHNLSIHQCFVKSNFGKERLGKGLLWSIKPGSNQGYNPFKKRSKRLPNRQDVTASEVSTQIIPQSFPVTPSIPTFPVFDENVTASESITLTEIILPQNDCSHSSSFNLNEETISQIVVEDPQPPGIVNLD